MRNLTTAYDKNNNQLFGKDSSPISSENVVRFKREPIYDYRGHRHLDSVYDANGKLVRRGAPVPESISPRIPNWGGLEVAFAIFAALFLAFALYWIIKWLLLIVPRIVKTYYDIWRSYTKAEKWAWLSVLILIICVPYMLSGVSSDNRWLALLVGVMGTSLAVFILIRTSELV